MPNKKFSTWEQWGPIEICSLNKHLRTPVGGEREGGEGEGEERGGGDEWLGGGG